MLSHTLIPIITLMTLGSVLCQEYLSPTTLYDNEDTWAARPEAYVVVRDGYAYIIDIDSITVVNVFGTDPVVYPSVGAVAEVAFTGYRIYNHDWSGDVLFVASHFSAGGTSNYYLFAFNAVDGSVEIVHSVENDFLTYCGVAVGETTGYFFAGLSGEIVSFDLETLTVNEMFFETEGSESHYGGISIYTLGGVEYGVTVRSNTTGGYVVVLNYDGIFRTVAIDSATVGNSDFPDNTQLYDHWLIYKTLSRICVYDLIDLDAIEETIIDSPAIQIGTGGFVHSSCWAVAGHLWALEFFIDSPNVYFTFHRFVLETQDFILEATNTSSSTFLMGRPNPGAPYLTALSLDTTLFITGEESVEVPNVNRSSTDQDFLFGSSEFPVAIYVTDTGISVVTPEGQASAIPDINIGLSGRRERDISWYAAFDQTSHRLIAYSPTVLFSQYVFTACEPDSGFYGTSCMPCLCQWGTCDDGFENDGSCSCNLNVAGDICDDCEEGFFGESETSTCVPCTCVSGVCDGGLEGTGECVGGTCEENFGGVNCDTCTGNYAGENCDECAGNFAGEFCDQCVIGWTGAQCDSCDVNFEGDNCDTCVGNFAGDFCNECAGNFAGANCITCTRNFAGENCDECAEGKTGDDCSEDASNTSTVLFLGITSFIVLF